MITRRFALFLLLALSALRVAAHEPPLVGGAPEDTVDVRRAAAAISPMTLRGAAKESPAASLTLRRSLPRRKGRAAWRSPRREWGVQARLDVIAHGELPRLAGLASGSYVSLTFDILDRLPEAERGPPSS